MNNPYPHSYCRILNAMQYALAADGCRIEAQTGVAATCPICGASVIAKCGRIRVHHWAHQADLDCDSWFEPETDWHRGWKALFPLSQTEVVMGEHRADILTSNRLVVELQHSPIGSEQIEERERFYRNMIWLVDGSDLVDRFFLMKRMGADLLSFKWKNLRPSWRYARKPVFLDFGSRDVRSLLGGTARSRRTIATGAEDRTTSVVQNQIRRLGMGDNSAIDPSLASLSEDILSRSIFRIHTLYDNGRGSIQPVDRREFGRRLGICLE